MPRPGKRQLPKYLERYEIDALLAAAETPLQRLYFLFCCKAGLRAFEAAALCWDDIRLNAEGEPAALHIRHGKGDKEAWLPINRELRLFLTSHGIGTEGYIFPGRGGGHVTTRAAQFWIERAARAGGIPRSKARLHILRHSFATHLMRQGVEIPTIQELMRHSDPATTSIYLHVTPERMQTAVDLI